MQFRFAPRSKILMHTLVCIPLVFYALPHFLLSKMHSSEFLQQAFTSGNLYALLWIHYANFILASYLIRSLRGCLILLFIFYYDNKCHIPLL